MAVTNITKDPEDADVEKLVKGIGSIESFREAYTLDKMRTKQFTFPVLDDDVETFVDPEKWPSGVCCRAWNVKGRNNRNHHGVCNNY